MPKIWLAEQTKELILSTIYADQGRSYRAALKECINEVDDAFRSEEEAKFREHFGVSLSGRECARELWYKWRWAVWNRISARMLLLFNRGHLEEARFGAMFKAAGITIYQVDENGKQYRMSLYGGHYGSAIDGVMVGIPEMPEEPVLGEMKTHNEKSFSKLAGKKNKETGEREGGEGVKLAKPEHYAQMQQYMGEFELKFAIYCAVNKDTDELYFEIIPYVKESDEFFRQRSHRIIFARQIPPKLSENAGFWKCKYCECARICHYDDAPEVNCRTCTHSEPQEDGTWLCRNHGIILDKATQLAGCDEWDKHPSL